MVPSIAAKKSKRKRFVGWLNSFKSANSSASQPNSTPFSVSSGPGAHDLGPGNDAERAEPTASGKDIGAILLLSTTTQLLSRL